MHMIITLIMLLAFKSSVFYLEYYKLYLLYAITNNVMSVIIIYNIFEKTLPDTLLSNVYHVHVILTANFIRVIYFAFF